MSAHEGRLAPLRHLGNGRVVAGSFGSVGFECCEQQHGVNGNGECGLARDRFFVADLGVADAEVAFLFAAFGTALPVDFIDCLVAEFAELSAVEKRSGLPGDFVVFADFFGLCLSEPELLCLRELLRS